MAKYAKTGRFLADDFQEAAPWFKDRFFRMLNRFKEQIEAFVDKGMTVNDNMLGSIQDLTVITDGSAAPAQPLTYKFTLGKPRLVICGGCVDTTSAETPAPNPNLTWTYEGEVVTVMALSGLSANKSYRLTVLTLVN